MSLEMLSYPMSVCFHRASISLLQSSLALRVCGGTMVVQGCCGNGVLSGCQATVRELIGQNSSRTLEYSSCRDVCEMDRACMEAERDVRSVT